MNTFDYVILFIDELGSRERMWLIDYSLDEAIMKAETLNGDLYDSKMDLIYDSEVAQ